MSYKTKIGEFYGANIIVETILEKRDGYSKDFGDWQLDSLKLGKIIEQEIKPYMKFPIPYVFSFEGETTAPVEPRGIPAKIERVEIKIIYKEK